MSTNPERPEEDRTPPNSEEGRIGAAEADPGGSSGADPGDLPGPGGVLDPTGSGRGAGPGAREAASPSGKQPPAAIPGIRGALAETPHGFSFFQAVRLLERLHPSRSRVGGWGDPDREVARFSVPAKLSFPPGEIHALEMDEADENGETGPAQVAVNFMGLTGPLGVLPYEYTRMVAERNRARDRAPGDFLDLFHHRFISLFYLAWRKGRLDLDVEDPPEDGGLVRHLLDLLGLGLEEFQGTQTVPDGTLIHYAGLFMPQPRGAAALEQLLEDRLGIPVDVEEFVGGWFPLPQRDHCRLGEEGGATSLGGGAVVGDEIWDQQSRVRLRLGPLSRDQYHRFLPGGEGHRELGGLVRFFSHDQFDFEVQLVLRSDDVPGVVLGAEDEEESQPLGWCTWIRSRERDLDGEETVLAL